RGDALLLRARSRGRVRGAGVHVLLCRQRDLPEGDRPPPGGPPGAERAAARGDRLPLPRAAAGARQAERAGERAPHRALGGRIAWGHLRGARTDGRRELRARLRAVSEDRAAGREERASGEETRELRQASLRRLRSFGVRPNRELGQNFLIDDNILRLISEAAELAPGDVVLEVGGGLGVLSEFLAPRVGHLHVVEIDRSLAPPLEDALGPFENATLHLADAVRMNFAELSPTPSKVVANLPYGVAATVLLKSVAELPGAGLCV